MKRKGKRGVAPGDTRIAMHATHRGEAPGAPHRGGGGRVAGRKRKGREAKR